MFPVNLDLRGKLVLMVGAGRVGRRKLCKIIAAGAKVRLVEPEPEAEIKLLVSEGRLEIHAVYGPELLDGVSLVFAATDKAPLNRIIAEEARTKGLWTNIADAPELSDFTLPAVVDHGLLQLTVSTGGASPALAARIADDLRLSYGPQYGTLAAVMAELRPMILSSGLDLPEREKIFKKLVNSPGLQKALVEKRKEPALNLLSELISPLTLPAGFKLPA